MDPGTAGATIAGTLAGLLTVLVSKGLDLLGKRAARREERQWRDEDRQQLAHDNVVLQRDTCQRELSLARERVLELKARNIVYLELLRAHDIEVPYLGDDK